jgi:glycosyltransferase involved in cell wall biosynthesis
MSPWLLATGDFTTLGGMDRANHALASYLARHGRQVHLVAHRVAPDLAAAPGVRTRLVSRPFGAHLLAAPLLARAAAQTARALGGAARVLMNGGNGVIGAPAWVHYLHAAYEPAVRSTFRTRVSASAGRRYYLARERAALTAAPLVICNSERTADDVVRAYGVARSRIHVIYYGSDERAFAFVTGDQRRAARAALAVPDGRRAAVFIGALADRRKGFDVLFDAWRTMSAEPAWDVDLLVAGEGSEAAAWSARAVAAGLGNVRFLGFRPDIATVLAAADVLVHPARYEPYGLGVHEAVCRGIPAIVTSIAGVTERFPPTLAGLVLSAPPEAHALATTLRAWRAGADSWRARVVPTSDALRRRSWDDMSAEIVAAVEAAA